MTSKRFLWSDPKARAPGTPFARPILPIVFTVAGLLLGSVALTVVGNRGPKIAGLPPAEGVGPDLVAEAPPLPATPPAAERPKREGAVALLRRGEDLTQYTDRLLRRARGLEEGIERMFARDLEEGEKKRLFELGLGPVDQVEALPSTVSAEARAQIAERLVALAAEQFSRARTLQRNRSPSEPVFVNLLEGASRFHAESQVLLRETLENRPSKG
ncbi:MAG TPA: hypothetical protein VFI25_08535 [Planctomycetota bacterium]|jgi:hypothetical protein|nr:hypothetical protein [Planctomycetota bacterium]